MYNLNFNKILDVVDKENVVEIERVKKVVMVEMAFLEESGSDFVQIVRFDVLAENP